MGWAGARLTKLVVLSLLTLAVTASSGAAAPPARGRMLGVVPHTGAAHASPKSAAFASPSFLTFDANYESLINRYFADVAAASGTQTNVYSIAEQYFDGSGNIQYQSAFGGSYVDTDPLPVNGCNDGSDAVCLTDSQIQAEIQNALTANGWHGSTSALFVLMTPNGVGSCFDGSSQECTTTVPNGYCAYHSAFTDSAGEQVIYANEPYNATINGCSPGSSPNGDDADAEINTISHEHNEAITDPFGDAWYRESDGSEDGDLCAWTFGAPLGGAGLTQYNQVINGHDYWLQQEWSNQGRNCFQNATQEKPPSGSDLAYHGGLVMHTNTTYAIYWLPTSGNTGAPVVSGTAAVNQTLTSSTGAWNGAPTGYSYQWQRCTSSGTGCADIPGATDSTYTLTPADGGEYIRSTVSAANVNGSSPYAASAGESVVPVPAASALPIVSGRAGVGKKLTVTSGVWNTQAAYAYQWLRCAADGTHCRAIAGAAGTSHVALAADAGHTLQVRVSAANAAGSGEVLSKRSGVVVALPRLRKAPRIVGRVRVGGLLSATPGTWSGPPKSYRYEWLRCNTRGGSCTRIRQATHAKYRLKRTDASHRLRVRVTAVNAAGSRPATSQATGGVSAR
jgi:hypothetical protein